tara:strand:- start:357 stop:737 length:381 start_codon:yes stop_codon:yes gene_type:complete
MHPSKQITNLAPNSLYDARKFDHLPRKLNYCAVYIADMVETPFLKIGSSSNIRSRAVSYQTNSPFLINIPYIFCPPISVSHIDLELAVHHAMESLRVRGEWFECSVTYALETILAQRDDILEASAE